jgi:glucose/arabinose dehydrogenase
MPHRARRLATKPNGWPDVQIWPVTRFYPESVALSSLPETPGISVCSASYRGYVVVAQPFHRAFLAIVLLLPLAVFVGSTARAATGLPSGFQEKAVFTGLNHPTNVEFSPDGRVFVAEKSGIIKVFDSLTDTTPTVFADLRTEVHNFWDRGLLGLALHPNFPADPRVYVLYTYDGVAGGTSPKWGTPGATDDPCPTPPGPTSDGCQVSGRLSVLSPSGQPGAPPQEKTLVEDWCQQFPSHSIGTIAFGPDGMLYAGGGDGASYNYVDYGQDGYTASDVTPDNPCGDPPKPVGTALAPPSAEGGSLRAQDLRTPADPTTLDGGIIRIDPDTGAAAPGNPGSGDVNAKRLVAEGLRNPFRFTVRPGTNELWIGDVGMSTSEEINRIPAPAAKLTNLGWPCYEGAAKHPGFDAAGLTLCQNLYASPGTVTAPYYAYKHSAKVVATDPCPTGSSSLGGLAFYSGTTYPAAYHGALFFTDYSRKCVWTMMPGANGLPDPTNIRVFASAIGGETELQAGPGGDIFGVDYDGNRIVRYVYNGANNAPVAAIKTDRTSGAAPLTVHLDATASSDADGNPLTYSWDLDGDGVYGDSTAATVTQTYQQVGKVTVGLRVSDGRGGTDTAQTVITVGSTPPTATIASPSPGTRWKVGDAIAFSGTATDAEDGTLPGSALKWDLIMHHCPSNCHEHYITSMTGDTGTFVAPDHEYPSWLELRLTATDSDGLTDIKSVRLDPETADITLASSPAGFKVSAFDQTATAPLKRTLIVGGSMSIAAPEPQLLNGRPYAFGSWSDGGGATHNITAPASATTYTATFRPRPDLARGRPVKVSTTQKAGLEGSKAVDGSTSTRWSSVYSSPQWIRVDLGAGTKVGRAVLRWETAYGKSYRVQVSNDGSTWTTVYSTTTGNGGVDDIAFTARTTRYLRVYGIARGTKWGYSLWELEAYDR